MPQTDARVDAYIAKSADFAQPILTHLRKLIHAACPEVEETIKWSFPNFVYRGAVMCNMASFKEHCSFGFWRASLIEDTENILAVSDRISMGHLGKITGLRDLPKDTVLTKYIKAAMKLHDEGIKPPARAKASEKEKKELETPDYFMAELSKNPSAKQQFYAFSYSNRKEYIEWLTEAKTEATRNKRMATAIEWIAEGKSRNWKYQNC